MGWNGDSEEDNSGGDNSVAMVSMVAGMALSFILLATLSAIILVCLKWYHNIFLCVFPDISHYVYSLISHPITGKVSDS